MKLKTITLFITLFFLFNITWGKDSLLVTSPSDDSYTKRTAPDANWGNENYFVAGTNVSEFPGWVKFDTLINDLIPDNVTIDSAFFMCSQWAINGLCTLFVATPAGGWSETDITFNNQPDSVLTYLSDTLTAANWDTLWRWDISRIVDEYNGGALNGLDTTRGFVILDVNLDDATFNLVYFHSSEYGAEDPWIVIYYSDYSEGLTGIIPKVYKGVIQPKVKAGVINPKVRSPN